MKTKNILAIIVLLVFSLKVRAQEKYEYMIIEYTTHQKMLYVSIDGKEFAKEKPEENGWGNANPLLKKVNEFQDKNWEVINFSTVLAGDHSTDEIFFAYLRKKKTGN